ncbi:MAG: hypothetical protein GY801_19890 [bacterium]|nr:hypothetical protein [bacterium]
MQVEPEEKEMLIERLIQQIESFINSETLSAREIMKLPPNEKQRIVAEQFQEAEQLYKEHPEMIVSEGNSSMEWGEDLLNSQMSSNAYKEWLQAENDIYDDLFKDEVTQRRCHFVQSSDAFDGT